MKKSKHILPYNFIYILAIGVSIELIASKYIFLYLLLFIYVFLLRKNKYKRYLYICLSIFFLVSLFAKHESKIELKTSVKAEVYEVLENYSILKEEEKFIIYDTSYKPGDILNLTGEFKEITSNSIPYVFNFKEYLNKKGIFYSFKADKIEKIDYKFNYKILKYNIKNYIYSNYERADYYSALILSENDISNDSINNLGIAHMFCISGLHVNIILSFLKKVFKIKEKPLLIILLLYTVLLGFKVSLLRILLTNTLIIFNKKYSRFDNLCLSYLIILFFNPLYIFDYGFILTYLVTFSIYLSKRFTLIVANLVTIPITVSFNGNINLLSIIYNFIFSYIFKYFLLPLTFICFFIKKLDFIYSFVIDKFEYLMNLLDFNYSIISIPDFNSFEYILYFVFLFLFLNKNKIYYFFYLIIHLFKGLYIIGSNIIVFDVGQGDSTLIYTTNSVVMIDCYKDSYKFIKKRGIKKIDYLFLTHSHDDHIGSVDELLKVVEVENIVINYYDTLTFDNSIKAKSGDIIELDDMTFNVLGPIKDYDNINNDSLVLKFRILNYDFLYTGDIESLAENDLVKKYKNELKADVLKVPHHGSNTSSTEEFIKYVDPKISIISVGDNYYGHPAKETLEVLNNSRIYQTKKCGSIYMFGLINLKIY